MHGAVFADAGHAWTREFQSDAVKTSFGAEISARIVAGYFFPVDDHRSAPQWGHDGSHTVADGTTIYGRVDAF